MGTPAHQRVSIGPDDRGGQKGPSSEDWLLSYTYRNTPKLPLRKTSPEHRGGTVVTIFGEPPVRIEGEYWTSRDTKGTLAMDAHSPDIAQSFADAEALFVTGTPAG